jgi:hypothetical protein
MCFSAAASFGAGVVLSAIGIAAIKKVEHPTHILFASIPLIFAVQQIAEGFLWLSLPNIAYTKAQVYFTYIFVFFAQVVWPIWVPIAILLLEKEASRKRFQRVLVAAGLLVGCYLGYCLFNYPVQASIEGYHIKYKVNFPAVPRNIGIALYAMATILPPFFSHIKRMWMLGVAILISYIISEIFYEQYLLSVWCFFASVISLSIYMIMVEINNQTKKSYLKIIV